MTPSSQVEPPEGLSAQDWSQILALLPAEEAPQGLAAAGALLAQGSLASLDQRAYLKASNTEADDHFGHSVAVSGNTVVVGAPYKDSDAGAAYVFVRNGTTWSQQAYLKASNTDAGDEFGYSVAVSGDTVVVGAPGEDSAATGVDGDQDNNASSAGAAYIFVRSGATWSQQAYLKASNTGAYDNFGYSVAVSGDTVVVGAPAEDSDAIGVVEVQTDNNNASSAGAAYVFVRSGAAWSQQAYLKAFNTGNMDFFGWSVAVSGDTVVVGTPYKDSDAGAAYVFVRNGTTWSQQAYLKASNTEANDNFGHSVAVSGETVVVGAPYEDSNASFAGAAYVFVRTGTTWSQQAYLKAFNTGTMDLFGYSVAVSGDTVVVAAPYEDSNATGVNGDDSNNDASNAGAAYVFAPLPTIIVTAGAGGSITPPTGTVTWGTDATYTITPEAGYLIASLLVDGVALTGFDPTGDTHTFVAVAADHTISATFTIAPAPTFTLTYLSTPGGTLQGDTLQIVSEGADGTPVLAVPDEGYLFAGWSDWVNDNPRTDTQVTADITVRARFAPLPEPPLPVVYSVSAAVTQGEGSVSPAAQWVLAGKSATVDITSAPGYHLSEITVDGKPMPLLGPFVIEEVNTHHRVQVAFAPDEAPSPFAFLDVPQDHELYPAVIYLAERGIIAGYGDGNFGPYDPILRAQVAKMLVLALGGGWGYPYGNIPDFIDVPNDGSPYPYSFVMTAARAGVVVGYTDGRFRPYKAITRMQLVRMVVRAASELLEEPPAGYDPGFADVTDPADRALLATAHYNGLIDGTAPGLFSPAEPATRGEAAYALYRMLLLKEQGLQ